MDFYSLCTQGQGFQTPEYIHWRRKTKRTDGKAGTQGGMCLSIMPAYTAIPVSKNNAYNYLVTFVLVCTQYMHTILSEPQASNAYKCFDRIIGGVLKMLFPFFAFKEHL